MDAYARRGNTEKTRNSQTEMPLALPLLLPFHLWFQPQVVFFSQEPHLDWDTNCNGKWERQGKADNAVPVPSCRWGKGVCTGSSCTVSVINSMMLLKYCDTLPKKDKAELRNQPGRKKYSGEPVNKTQISHKKYIPISKLLCFNYADIWHNVYRDALLVGFTF